MKEESRAVASTFSISYWSFLLILSLFLIALTDDYVSTLVWAGFMFVLSFAAWGYRSRIFLRHSQELLVKGQVTSPYDLRRQHSLLIMMVALTIAAFFVPLLLSAALNSSVWIGSLLGVIDGWVLGLFLYNLFLLRWQKRNRGELFILEAWNGSRVTHLGLSFTKKSNGN